MRPALAVPLFLLLASAAACRASALRTAGTGDGQAPAREPAAKPEREESCTGPSLPPDPGCAGSPLCSRAERVRLTCDLRDALEARYVFFDRKGRLLETPGQPAFDARRQLDGCIAAEEAIPREEDPLRFVDRLRGCIAAFDDGHLFLAMPRPLPTVALGIRLRRTDDGRVLVAYRDPGVVRWLDEPPAPPAEGSAAEPQWLAIGDEVMAIDGRPVADEIADLERLVPASSEAARAERAVDALARRDFAYPERGEAILTVDTGGQRREVRLPWFVAPGGSSHPLAAPHLRRTGLETSGRIDWRSDSRGAWFRDRGSEAGLLRGDPVVPGAEAAALTTCRGDGGQLAVRLGEADLGGEAPGCYLQILSFHTEDLACGGQTRPFVEVLRDFVERCEARHRDLVLDLRQNEGGYLSHSSALAGMLTPGGTITPGGALLLRATAQNERVYRERSPMLGGSGPHGPGAAPSEPEQILSAIREARRTHDEFTPAFLEPPLSAGDGPGFRGRVVALTSPGCMSACDRLAAILKRGHRALLLGEPTEGAGASQQESKAQTARWVDRNGWVGVSIPNAAMGVQETASTAAGRASAERFFADLAFENRPVVPDVPYATTRRDVAEANAGWLAAVRTALQQAPAPPPR